MSTFLVSKAHIDVLVNAAARYGLLRTADEATEAGAMLWVENHRAVRYRYPHHDDEPPPEYRVETTEADFEPVALLKTISCYQYQVAEPPDWKDTAAYQWSEKLRAAIEATLPPEQLRQVRNQYGEMAPFYTTIVAYDNAPWGVDDIAEMPILVSVDTDRPPSSTQED